VKPIEPPGELPLRILRTIKSMHLVEELDSGTIERLEKQCEFLRRIHRTEPAKDPTSHETESSRSNLIAVQHTIEQMYGETVAQDVVPISLH